jgi:predicted RecA/RadA family phage recombinase
MAQDFQAKFVQRGDAIDYTPVAAVAAGAVVVVGGHIGITKIPIAAGALGALAIRGLFDVVKANEQQADGAAIYWDADGNPYLGMAGTGCATTTAGGNTFMGFAVGVAGATAETVRLDLIGVAAITNTVHNALTADLADPANAGAIPVADSGKCDLVTTVGAGETRTLAAPTYVGQELLLSLKTDGGDCVITCATGLNQTGNNTITMGDAGDSILLVGIAVGANKRWRVVANDGCALTTV